MIPSEIKGSTAPYPVMITRVPTVLTNFDGKRLLHHEITLFEGWELEKRWFYERRSTSEYFGDWGSYTVGGYNHALSSWFDMSARKYPPRVAFLPQNTVLGETVTIGIFQSTLWSHPPMHRRKHRAAAAALHWHRRRNELASKIMLIVTIWSMDLLSRCCRSQSRRSLPQPRREKTLLLYVRCSTVLGLTNVSQA